ncbi:hypothetical protein FRB99_006788 [Tulasnella sp. 403]|nr:hypothetical protein FRB99_006788 [Tulasnella sp. 403]
MAISPNALTPQEPVEHILDALRNLAYADPPQEPGSPHPPGALFARLKAINRNSNAAATTRREVTAEARTAINATNLGLQNLMYEKRHLEREIEKCRQFAFVYQDVPLHSLEEFEAQAPESLRTPEVLSDEHQLMLNRLEFELAERHRLDERRKALIVERDTVLGDTKKFQSEVDKLADPFERLSELAMEIQRTIHTLAPSPPPSPPPAIEEADTSLDTVMEPAPE